jgi:hypothetical protein
MSLASFLNYHTGGLATKEYPCFSHSLVLTCTVSQCGYFQVTPLKYGLSGYLADVPIDSPKSKVAGSTPAGDIFRLALKAVGVCTKHRQLPTLTVPLFA